MVILHFHWTILSPHRLIEPLRIFLVVGQQQGAPAEPTEQHPIVSEAELQQGAPVEPTEQHPIVSGAELQQGALVEPTEQHPIVSGVGIQRAAVGTEVLKNLGLKIQMDF